MAMRKRYSGEFIAYSGSVCRVDILQESASIFEVEKLEVVSLQIEWKEVNLEDPLCPSSATLVLNSPTDRKYLDLYSVAPGYIRLDIYRSGMLYWSGTLDTEFYEEPYGVEKNYDVKFVFSDFGILRRIPYNQSGRVSLESIVQTALSLSKINFSGLETLISTGFSENQSLSLSSLYIQSANFIDEDGIALDYSRVLKGILQPLALRIIQRGGLVTIYDINAIATNTPRTRRIKWDGLDGKLGVNRVYNNIRVTFSPYASATLTAGASEEGTSMEFNYGDDYGVEYINLTSESTTPDCYSFYVDYDPSHKHGYIWDYSLIDFTIFRSYDKEKCTGFAAVGYANAFFRFVSIGGSVPEKEGVAVGFYTGGHGSLESGFPRLKGIAPGLHNKQLALKTYRMLLQNAGPDDAYIKICLEILCDARYNPFQEASEDGNEGLNYEEVSSWAAQAFVPVDIVLYSNTGTPLYHYTNRLMTEKGHPADSIASTASKTLSDGRVMAGWVPGDSSFGEAWLAYYDCDDLIEGTGIMGWKTNRQNFGKPWSEGNKVKNRKLFYTDAESGEKKEWWKFDSFTKAPEGQYIPYPPSGGYLEIRVYNGIYIFDDTETFNAEGTGKFADRGLYGKLRWLLYAPPQATVVKHNLTYEEAKTEDVEYAGVLNPYAREDLALETICGTSPKDMPTARGIFLNESGDRIAYFCRAGVVDHAEQLLIGTLYSQYAKRKTVLSGEILSDYSPISVYLDAAQPEGSLFLKTSEEQDVISEVSRATFVEISPDDYIGT